MERQRLAFTRVAIAGRPALDFCVDLRASDDAQTRLLLDNHAIEDPAVRLLLGFVGTGTRVLDVGSHLGTFALPAAAAGGQVTALDAPPTAKLLRAAARRNDLTTLHVTETEMSDLVGQVAAEPAPDVIKLDVGGWAIEVLEAVAERAAAEPRPPVLLACDAPSLWSRGASVGDLHELIAKLGYELFLIEPRRRGVLVQPAQDAIQPEPSMWYLAVDEWPGWLEEGWCVETPYSREEVMIHLLDSASAADPATRRYSAEIFRDGPDWLQASPAGAAGVHALRHDVEPGVRAVFAAARRRGPADEHRSTSEADSDGIPNDVVVFAERLALSEAGLESEPLPAFAHALEHGALAVADVSFHVRQGQMLGILTDHSGVGSLLLMALAGAVHPVGGRLELRQRPLLLSNIDRVLEPSLSIRDNVILLSAFFGGHVPDVADRAAFLADPVDVARDLDRPLGPTDGATAIQLALTVALEHASDGLLLIDQLAPLLGDRFGRWAGNRVRRLRETGSTVIVLINDPARLSLPVDRLLWLADGRVTACGHPPSIAEAFRRHQPGLDS